MSEAVKRWEFAFGTRLDASLAKKLNDAGLLKRTAYEISNYKPQVMLKKDFFTPDGYPANTDLEAVANNSFICPVMAPWYTGAPVPESILKMDKLYRQKACDAAMSWLLNPTDSAQDNTLPNSAFNRPYQNWKPRGRSFHGLRVEQTVCGQNILFWFPDTVLERGNMAKPYAAVVLIADTYDNNEDWEHGSIPLYARQQAMFQLWCWEQFSNIHSQPVPEEAIIVRICGNLAADCTIRTVAYNEAEAYRLVDRICKAYIQESQQNLPIYAKRNAIPTKPWQEKKQEIMDNAYWPNDEDLHTTVKDYMAARSNRKQLEREVEEKEQRMQAIALELASRIPSAVQGTLTLPNGTICTVTHRAKRSYNRGATISAETLRSFFPSSLSESCITKGSERKTVSIDVL